MFIWFIPSSLNKEGEKLVGVPNHPNWIIFSRNTSSNHDSPRVISYINVRLLQFCFSLQKDIFNHKDISYVSFFNNCSIYFFINIYSDSSQTALKYLKDIEANINNILVITGNFNIRDNSWDPSFPYHSIHCNLLTDIADSMSLYIFKSTNQVPTRYSDNQNNLNSVIDLIFLQPTSSEFNNHTIHPEWRLLSDHTLLTIDIAIIEEHIQTKKHTIVKNSEEEEKNFLAGFIESIKELNTEHISSKENLE